MIYYKIKPAKAQEETTGYVWPQISNDSPLYQNKNKNSILNLEANRFSDDTPDLDYYELDKKAKLTDLLSGGIVNTHGLVVSERMKVVFEKYNTGAVRYHASKLKIGETFRNDYYLMQVVSDTSSFIDFKNSKFRVKKLTKDLGEIEIKSKADFEQKWKELLKTNMIITIEPEKFVMNNDFDKSLDIFIVNFLDYGIHISERVQKKIIDEGFSGVEMVKSNIIVSDF